jgi:hypothetical protein
MNGREGAAIFILAAMAVAIVIADHRSQLGLVLNALSLPGSAPAQPSSLTGVAAAPWGSISSMFGTTNGAIPDVTNGPAGALKIATPSYQGGQSAFGNIWNNLQ